MFRNSDSPRSTQELEAIGTKQAEELLKKAKKMKELIDGSTPKELSETFDSLPAIQLPPDNA